MTTAIALSLNDVEWPAAEAIASDRVRSGSPEASTLVLHEGSGRQVGLWTVSPGEFTTDHTGYVEYVHIIQGRGRLVDEAGNAIELRPGITVLMESGWKGRWVVEEQITKSFTVLDD
ncbi:cupin domain-containing protein [Gulosibacter sp. 10]|uniref:cupin domain-containing protein n=1 Tax=Gulosibacter sp. 10 TaxID=1255570 RepID=UPI00097F42F4|nr:cupin domain-containing protein [Gulosibacter sp. 10]SJM64506.1 hypothetical protein FM112_10265 [Gulosibacter sp. 10]